MNVTLKLTMYGLIEALRWKALEKQKDDGRPLLPEARDSNASARSTNDGQ